MKNLLIRTLALTAGLLFGSLAQASDPKTVIEGYMAAWNAHDAEKAASFFAEDGEYFDASVGTPQKGRENAKNNVIKVFIDAVPDCKWVMDGEPIVSKNGIAFRWTYTGTNTGAWGPETPATNKAFTLQGVSFVTVKHDKITYQGDYYDALGFNKALGWIK